jgi:hypothetical protein
LSLFGPLSGAWSVRRYWGKHWHNYVYHSFSGHVKILTRQWLGFKGGRLLHDLWRIRLFSCLVGWRIAFFAGIRILRAMYGVLRCGILGKCFPLLSR